MSPRPYRSERRQAATAETRGRVLEAARSLLSEEQGPGDVSIDAIAQRAGVARMTVYYQFKSKAGLLEALFDDHAQRGGLTTALPAAFALADPLAALDAVIAAFCRFWGSQRTVQRRLMAAGALDLELEAALRARNQRRRQALDVLVTKIAEATERPEQVEVAGAVDVLYALTGFAAFDSLAETRDAREVANLLARTARSVLGVTASNLPLAMESE